MPWREARISVRPGITGLWQVCRHDREAGDFHQWIEYDVLYVRQLTFWLDVKILIATVLTLGGKVSHVAPSTLVRINAGHGVEHDDGEDDVEGTCGLITNGRAQPPIVHRALDALTPVIDRGAELSGELPRFGRTRKQARNRGARIAAVNSRGSIG